MAKQESTILVILIRLLKRQPDVSVGLSDILFYWVLVDNGLPRPKSFWNPSLPGIIACHSCSVGCIILGDGNSTYFVWGL